MKIPYIDLAVHTEAESSELLDAVARVLGHGQYILGPEVEAFENEFAGFCGAHGAVGVNSGTDALLLALKAFGVGPGDEVVTVSHSFVATASAIALTGATPVFIDVDKDQNLDPDLLENAYGEKTKGIVPVHLTGRPSNMDAIIGFAERHGLFVLEDAAQAVAATYKGRRVGSLGDAAAFSFHPLKNLSACGDGGIVTSKHPWLLDRVKQLRNLGLRDRDHCMLVAGNSRLDALQAAILRVKLRQLPKLTEHRRQYAERYHQALESYCHIPRDDDQRKSVFHTYVIQTPARDSLRDHLLTRGIETKIHYPVPIHRQPAFEQIVRWHDLPQTERLASEILSLPIGQHLALRDIEIVAEAIQAYFNER